MQLKKGTGRFARYHPDFLLLVVDLAGVLVFAWKAFSLRMVAVARGWNLPKVMSIESCAARLVLRIVSLVRCDSNCLLRRGICGRSGGRPWWE